MNEPRKLHPWTGLVALTFVSLIGSAPSRSSINTIEHERLLQSATAAIEQLPLEIGPWRGAPGEILTDDLLRKLGCRACLSQTYTNEETGEKMSLLVMAGGAGPLAAFPPQACYEGEPFVPVEAAQLRTIEPGNEFIEVALRSPGDSRKTLRSFVGWRAPRGRWEAPRNPQSALGAQPMLFRLQLATETRPSGSDSQSDPARNFLSDLIPALNQVLDSR